MFETILSAHCIKNLKIEENKKHEDQIVSVLVDEDLSDVDEDSLGMLIFCIGDSEVQRNDFKKIVYGENSESMELYEASRKCIAGFLERNFDLIIKIQNENEQLVRELAKERTAECYKRIYHHYRKIHASRAVQLHWLKKWASLSYNGKSRYARNIKDEKLRSKLFEILGGSFSDEKRSRF